MRRPVPAFAVAVAIGVVAGLLLTGWVLAPGAPRSSVTAPISQAPAYVDPQFLPDFLSSPVSTSNGQFGHSLAVSGSTVAIGAPGEETYVGGYYEEGLVHIKNLTTGATHEIGAFGNLSIGDFGWSVAIGGGYIAVGAPGEGYGLVDDYDIGHVFVYNATTFAPVAIFESPNAVVWYSDMTEQYYTDGFGASVAISGNQMVVGAPGENASGVQGAGHAYVINLKTGATTMLASPLPQPLGGFGRAVAISGNYVAVGAPDEGLFSFGNTYVFSATTGDLLESLSDSAASEGSSFGSSVALDWPWLAVGTPGQTDPRPCPGGIGAGQCGAVFLFNLQNGTQSELTSPTPTGEDEFGASVAMTSSLVLVGAPESAPDGAMDTGAAFLFSIATGELVNSTFDAPEWPASAEFGSAVGLNASAAFVGAPGEHADGFAGAGLGFVFTKIPWSYGSPYAPQGSDFGHSVSSGTGGIAVGAPNETVGSFADAGRVYFEPSVPGPILTLKGTSANEQFGASIGLTQTYLAVGAPGAPGYGGGTGEVFVFYASNGSLFRSFLATGAPLDGFGTTLAISGTTLLVGVPGAGVVDFFNVSTGSSPGFVTDDTPGTEFGASLAVDGSAWVIGAPGVGHAFWGTLPLGVPTEFSDPTGSLTGEFGASVAIAGNSLVIGAPDDAGGGRAFVFAATSPFALQYSLTDPNATSGGEFGASVAVSGGTIVVGAPGEAPYGMAGAGNVFIYAAGNGALGDRYNSPAPGDNLAFGSAVAIGAGGRILVGDSPPALDGNANAYLFFL